MDELDRALTDDDTLMPSSGFAARVMDAVDDDDAEPPPLAFPWRPFLIGVVACLIWAASAIWVLARVDLTILDEVIAPLVEFGPLPLYGTAFVLTTMIVLALRPTTIRR